MPGSGLSVQELQEQIKALQEQLKAMEGDGGAQFVPHLKDPELTPKEQPRWGNLPYIREEDGRQEKPN